MSKFLSVGEAKSHEGVRLVLTAGAPGPWGEAVKGMFYVKNISHVRVRRCKARIDPRGGLEFQQGLFQIVLGQQRPTVIDPAIGTVPVERLATRGGE